MSLKLYNNNGLLLLGRFLVLDNLKIKLQYILPKHLISRLLGRLAQAQAGFVTTQLITWFARYFKVNLAEAKLTSPKDYKTFNDFFTRELKEGARPIESDPAILCHPVDGAVSQAGPLDGDTIIQAKGHDYSAVTLLGGSEALAAPFQNGTFATVYLSPRDYHRIHMPIDGVLTDMVYVPGDLFSVNPLTAANVPNLFARNERVVAIFDTSVGKMAMVLVGATIVASIETVWAGTVTPPTGPQVHHWTYPVEGDEAIHLKKGEELGRFKLGSTIVALFEPGAIELNDLAPSDVTVLGTPFASVRK